MKDNLESKVIGNRKLILELRFEPIVSVLDKRGSIVESIQHNQVFSAHHWEISQSEVLLRDHADKKKANNFITVSFNRLSFISFKVDTVDGYFSTFKKIYDAVFDIIGKPEISRIGCRIIGSYKVKSNSYNEVFKGFKNLFPSQILLENYPSKDMSFSLIYDNGMYNIGPLNDEDDFYAREFQDRDCNKHVGVAIDTDNYLTNEKRVINEFSLIKDVYVLSLSVEKDIYGKLCVL